MFKSGDVPHNKGKILPTKYPQLRDPLWLQERLNCKTLHQIAREVGCCYKRVVDAKVELGLTPQNGILRKPPAPVHPEIVAAKDEIIHSYLSGNETLREISNRFEVPYFAVFYYVHRKWRVGKPVKTKKMRPDGKVITKEDIERVYLSRTITSKRAARELGISLRAFREQLKKHGFETKKRRSSCPQLNDSEWLKNEYFTLGNTPKQIAEKLGVSKSMVSGAISRYLPKECRANPGCPTGKNAPNWRGGRRTRTKGYIALYLPDHPRATSDGYYMEHRHVIEQSIGRYLLPTEIVHHRDLNPANNSIENLELVSDQGSHTRDHFRDGADIKRAESENARLRALLAQHNIDSDTKI